MGSAELIEKIRADGRARVVVIQKERDEELARIEQRSMDEVAKLEQEYRARVEREARLTLERARSRSRLEQRKALLTVKWQQIDKVLGLAAKRVTGEKDYAELMRGVVERFAQEDSVVRFSKADAARLQTGKAKAGEPAEIAGGVVIEQGRVTLDFSVDRALEAVRGRLATELAEVLFPEEG